MKQVKTYTLKKTTYDIMQGRERSYLIENKTLNELNDYYRCTIKKQAKSIKSLISQVNKDYTNKNACRYVEEYIELVNETTQENKDNKDFVKNHFIIATIK